MEVEALIATLVRDLQQVPGVVAIVLGGSRARGTHTAQSDIDLALYYRPDQPPDLARLGEVATSVDDAQRRDLITPLGGWGPWINGGGWLTVQGIPVDLLYRDLQQVTHNARQSIEGQPQMVYQPGHPHGFVTAIYLAEVALCRVLWDPTEAIAALKRLSQPYPGALQAALIRQFFWEAGFMLTVARKALARRDVSYIAGCCYRSAACLLQTLFALNQCYWMNEKGAVTIAGTFPCTPPRLAERLEGAFLRLEASEERLERAIADLESLVADTARLLREAGFSA